jgi:hypothetical protein
MASVTNLPGGTFPASGTIAAFTLVKINSSRQIAACAVDTNKDCIGVTQQAAVVNDQTPVRFLSAGTFKVKTDNSAIVVGTLLYKGASGKVSAASTGSTAIGYALDANGSTDSTIIEVMPLQH